MLPAIVSELNVIIAIILCVAIAGVRVYFWWNQREFSRVNSRVVSYAAISDEKIKAVDNKVNILFEKTDELNRDISYIKTHVAGIHESVGWIKEYIKDKRNI